MANASINKLAKTLAETLPRGLKSARDDLENNFRSVLHSGLDKLDLVTREEFEVQEAVLARTRQKLEALEVRLALIESDAPKSKKKKAAKKAQRKSAKKKSAKKKPT
jgi:BMFP domain-containing protein YqiC